MIKMNILSLVKQVTLSTGGTTQSMRRFSTQWRLMIISTRRSLRKFLNRFIDLFLTFMSPRVIVYMEYNQLVRANGQPFFTLEGRIQM
jgi:hypothetical protein